MNLGDLFGVELPVIQAPMAGSQDSELAIAVSNAGGLGSLPCALLSPEALRTQLTALRNRTNKPFNVNFFCHTPPAADADREAAWRKLLSPYFKEYEIDPAAVIPGRVAYPLQPRSGRRAGTIPAPRGEFSFWLAVGGTVGARARLGFKNLILGDNCCGGAVAR